MGRIWTRPRTPVAAQLLRPGRKPIGSILPNSEKINYKLLAWWPQIRRDGKINRDIGPHGYHLDVTGTTWDASRRARNYDGIDDKATNDDMPIPASATGQPERTIAAWVKLDTSSQDSAIAGHFNFLNHWDNYGIGIRYQNGDFQAIGEQDSDKTPLSYTLADTTSWHHILGTFSANGELWVDGVLRDSGDISSGWGYHFGVGHARSHLPESQGRYFDGSIDDVRYWSRRLSAAEITRLFRDEWFAAKSANDRAFVYPQGAAPSGSIARQHYHHRHHNRAG